jgi:hypothetical protein
VSLKKACLRLAYFKYLILGTCTSETKRNEEKIFTLIMNKTFILIDGYEEVGYMHNLVTS